MKIETKQKIKEFYGKRKLEIIAGSLIIGGIIIAVILKPEKVEIHDIEVIEVLPEWAEKKQRKCMDENLLCSNDLPIFADDSHMTIYSDAFVDDRAMNEFKENGYSIIERT